MWRSAVVAARRRLPDGRLGEDSSNNYYQPVGWASRRVSLAEGEAPEPSSCQRAAWSELLEVLTARCWTAVGGWRLMNAALTQAEHSNSYYHNEVLARARNAKFAEASKRRFAEHLQPVTSKRRNPGRLPEGRDGSGVFKHHYTLPRHASRVDFD